jgi:DNA gyrase subunit B
MQPLIEAGYVYLAKPPLYRVKAGKTERYIEKESELEDFLLSDKFDKFKVFDKHGTQFGLTEARWQRLGKLLNQYDGWVSALRAAHGNDLMTFIEESSVLDEGALDADALLALFRRPSADGDPFSTEVVSEDPVEIAVRSVEVKTGHARTHRIRRGLVEAPEYRQLVRVHEQLIALAGTPPFQIRLGDRAGEALTFGALREQVLELSRHGVDVNRFKGLGEMDPAQLRDTTMDPARRTLIQVNVEDAVEADRTFSILMGESVESRRQFIEDNARLVANLDV